jgi:hypothetical protein
MTSPGPTPPASGSTVPDALDVSRPNVARAYDYLLGGYFL